MNPLIDHFIASKRIAVIGMSSSGKKFGNYVCKELESRGYEIFPIHPGTQMIDGRYCYPDLESLGGKVQCVWISISPQKVPAVLKEANKIGLKNIWLQQGAWSPEVQQTIDQLGLPVISKKCILMYAPPVHSIHKFHRTLKGIFGGL